VYRRTRRECSVLPAIDLPPLRRKQSWFFKWRIFCAPVSDFNLLLDCCHIASPGIADIHSEPPFLVRVGCGTHIAFRLKRTNQLPNKATICIPRSLANPLRRTFKPPAKRPLRPISWLRCQIHNTDISGIGIPETGLSVLRGLFFASESPEQAYSGQTSKSQLATKGLLS
jgi:hypothetical protein